MRAGLTTSIFTLGLAFQLVAADSWTDYSGFSCPSNTQNDCSSQQQQGFDWHDLPPGPVDSYNDFSFSGFTCQNSFSKRDTLIKRTFNVSSGSTIPVGPMLTHPSSPNASQVSPKVTVAVVQSSLVVTSRSLSTSLMFQLNSTRTSSSITR
jgi:hypothetical protein